MTSVAFAMEGLWVEVDECDLDSDADIALDRAYADLDAEERARAAGFVFAQDRDRFVRSRGYLRQRLAQVVGVAPRDVPILAEDGGKPFVQGHSVRFNLSHSGSHAVIAIVEGGDVGIDLELRDARDGLEDQLDDLASYCMTGVERRALSAMPRADRVGRFLAYWTAKEARMKLTGEGMKLDPLSIELELSGGRPVGYRRPDAPVADLRFVPLSRPDATCCVAVRRAPE